MTKPKSNAIRAFVAAWADDATRLAVQALRARLERRCPAATTDIKWVEPERLHLTLRFLGDVSPNAIAALVDAMTRAAQTPSLDLELRGVGAFPNLRRAETIWIRVASGAERFASLAERVSAELSSLGFAKESRPFKAHLTIGRAKRAPTRAFSDALLAEQDAPVALLRVASIRLVKSQLTRFGPIYETLAIARLTSESE